ncbi:c-type cytochrome [Neoaquamicrobium sediminum]|uniref:Cytochrome c n=3 Tax=Neoaquamicrobium sediminum TaxID=1849104 RepID=A0ABV3X1D6_9HYPH
MEKHPTIVGVVGGVVGTILLGIVVWLTIAYTGVYNVAASDQHFDAVRWTLDTTMHRSVANRAGGVDLPENVSEDLLAEGAGHYAESCAHCHGGPGQEPAGWSRGMRPEPPHLTEAATEWTGEEIYWIAANGIKMTGMPAFGEHHSPEEITAIAVFISALPGLSADDYSRLTGSAQGQAEETPAPAAGDVPGGPPPGAAESQSE